jgi:Flp pilus assembly pilin Flp
MFAIFIRLLRKEDGFTPTEYGLMAALILIAVEQMAAKF